MVITKLLKRFILNKGVDKMKKVFMTMQEINKKLEELCKQEFYLQMKDRWTAEDYETDRKMNEEIRQLKEELKELIK